MCGATGASMLAELVDRSWERPGRFRLVRCGACSLAYLSPRPAPASMELYYRDFYGEKGLAFELDFQHGWFAGLIDANRIRTLLARRRIGPGDAHLDVGCGLGAFALRLAKRTGAAVSGVDMSDTAIDHARRIAAEHGVTLTLHRGFLESAPFAPGSFASVSMNHFLEHVYDPIGELSRARALLGPGGVLLVEVPSYRALARMLFGEFWMPHCAPQHLVLWSATTLRAALEKAGFRDVRVRDAWTPLVVTASLAIWWRWHLGESSRLWRSAAGRVLSRTLAIPVFLVALLLDASLSWLPPLLGRSEAIRATALR